MPDSIHPKSRLFNIAVRNPRHPLILPSINLYPAILIIRKRQPLVTPWTWADCIGMSSTGRCRIHAELTDDVACWTYTESADVASDIGRVSTCGGEEVFIAMRYKDDIGTV